MAIGPTKKLAFLRHRYKLQGHRADPTALCRGAIRVRVARGVAVAIAAFATAASAAGYDPKAIFYSDIVLRGAFENIGRMQEAELRAFTHYLAECAETTTPYGKHGCATASSAYEIEFGDKRPLDDMIHARDIMYSLPPDQMTARDIVETSVAYGKILAALEQAVSNRFRSLKAARK